MDNSLFSLLSHGSSLSACVKSCLYAGKRGAFPIQISGIKGSLFSFFVRMYAEEEWRRLEPDIPRGGRSKPGSGRDTPRDILIVVPTQNDCDAIQSDLETSFYPAAERSFKIITIPWWGVIPYRPCAKGSAVFASRARGLSEALSLGYGGEPDASPSGQPLRRRIFIVSLRTFTTPVPPPSYLAALTVWLRKGQKIDIEELTKTFTRLGYIRVSKVGLQGEFAVRGEVLDIFTAGALSAHRITLEFETIERIRAFDPDLQLTIQDETETDSLMICPMKEVIWNETLCSRLEEKFNEEDESGIRNDFAAYDRAVHREQGTQGERGTANKAREANSRSAINNNANSSEKETNSRLLSAETNPGTVHLSLTEEARKERDRILLELLETGESEGEELFYGVLFDKKYTLIDYLSPDCDVLIFDWDRLLNAQKMLDNEYAASYRIARLTLPVFSPSEIHLNLRDLIPLCTRLTAFRSLDPVNNIVAGDEAGGVPSDVPGSSPFQSFSTALTFKSEVSQSYFGNIVYLKEQLSSLMNEAWHVFIYADNENQTLRINEILKDIAADLLSIIPKPLTQGFAIADDKILVISEREIFRRRKSAPASIRRSKSRPIDTFTDLAPGDYVVHVNYGIGLFKGIERIKSRAYFNSTSEDGHPEQTERDYIKLEYADEELVFVPIEQVNMVQRYIGDEREKPKLDRIGSKSWSQRKARVQAKVEETARRLIDLYSKRKASRGYAFPPDNEWSAVFEAAFPYEDTADQHTVTGEVKRDMEKSTPMDRLICGDVGYGKTEIAMRASFKAVMGGKQVAFLAPTTILVEQHYESFSERFRNFPVTVAELSRFVSGAEQKRILSALERGRIDILIGTHRILQKDVYFKDLGLLIIDEEQRFGVQDKEKLKMLKTNIDCLALSATPIPRTLHMSLLKIRDISLLTTPPQNRKPIETFIGEYDDEKVKRAIRDEMQRGGQIFYLHNRVESLDEVIRKLRFLVPEAMIDVAHGQMPGDELDDIFRRFKMGGFQVLVSTTIIENGIDIPNVNTIIIDRADMYGISQLYQLRGRVGRSDRKAYAYLFYPAGRVLSEVAIKRLQVISDFTELGSGFKIAMKDMEIRGTGNLLGSDQSGDVYSVGYEMYISLLNAAIEKLLNSGWQSPSEVVLELDYTGYIPDEYIQDAQIKMEIYKKIASVQNMEELAALRGELEDRFGPVPEEVISLLSLAEIRCICNKLHITRLNEKHGNIYIEFGEVSKVNIDKVLTLIKTSSGRVRLDAAAPNRLILKSDIMDLTTKSEFIKEHLEMLA